MMMPNRLRACPDFKLLLGVFFWLHVKIAIGILLNQRLDLRDTGISILHLTHINSTQVTCVCDALWTVTLVAKSEMSQELSKIWLKRNLNFLQHLVETNWKLIGEGSWASIYDCRLCSVPLDTKIVRHLTVHVTFFFFFSYFLLSSISVGRPS